MIRRENQGRPTVATATASKHTKESTKQYVASDGDNIDHPEQPRHAAQELHNAYKISTAVPRKLLSDARSAVLDLRELPAGVFQSLKKGP